MAEGYEVIVVGAGHAGCEAAHAAARMGMRSLLLTMSRETIAQMSCNPAIGGLGKSQLVREIDALGGLMAEAIDHTGIQFRTLNTRKGPAVQALRAQADRAQYAAFMRHLLEHTGNLDIACGMASAVRADHHGVTGIETSDGRRYQCRTVILTTGTFLNGLIHIGPDMEPGGRVGEPPALGLSDSLRGLGLVLGRLKTGTPPRLDRRTIDYSRMQVQPGDDNPPAFSFAHRSPPVLETMPQVPCHLTRTTVETRKLILDNLDRAPLFTGQIQGMGPRYCPSIEDKVHRFADKETHHVFIEPEGRDSPEVYPNGISTSLPRDVQVALVHSIAGLEHAAVIRAGYAIEYDYSDPIGLLPTLESKTVPGLFLAGQINGTSGYEEAGAQGILAGINAGARCKGIEPLILGRAEAYLGVMVDDLVTCGTTEPYRMFTSRAEFRLLLRQDNADLRLTAHGRRFGLIDDARYGAFCRKQEAIAAELDVLKTRRAGGSTLFARLANPATTIEDLHAARAGCTAVEPDDPSVLEHVLIECKYSGYIERQRAQVERAKRFEGKLIPASFSFEQVPGMRAEARQKFSRIRPQSIGQASRIQGITPADIALLLAVMKQSRC